MRRPPAEAAELGSADARPALSGRTNPSHLQHPPGRETPWAPLALETDLAREMQLSGSSPDWHSTFTVCPNRLSHSRALPRQRLCARASARARGSVETASSHADVFDSAPGVPPPHRGSGRTIPMRLPLPRQVRAHQSRTSGDLQSTALRRAPFVPTPLRGQVNASHPPSPRFRGLPSYPPPRRCVFGAPKSGARVRCNAPHPDVSREELARLANRILDPPRLRALAGHHRGGFLAWALRRSGRGSSRRSEELENTHRAQHRSRCE